MTIVLRIISLAFLAVAVFCRNLFTSELLYWSMFGFSALFITLMWFSMFWVTKKRARKVLGYTPDFDIFVGKVPAITTEDLCRGRLCVTKEKTALVHKEKNKYVVSFSENSEQIKSISFNKVAGVRKGFTLHTETDDASFTCSSINKHKQELYKALNWDIK